MLRLATLYRQPRVSSRIFAEETGMATGRIPRIPTCSWSLAIAAAGFVSCATAVPVYCWSLSRLFLAPLPRCFAVLLIGPVPPPPCSPCPHPVRFLFDRKVRARLEKKLQIKQKAAFAFNFTVDVDDTDDLQGREQGSFRFDFNPPDTAIAGKGAAESKERSSGGCDNPRASEDFVVEIEGRRAGPNSKNKSKKKGAGKKKKGGKRKAKVAEQERTQDLTGELQPQQDLAPKPPSLSPVGDGGGQTTSCRTPLVEGDSKPKSDDGRQESATPDDVGEKSNNSKTLRPPPGFTLESWKDPALSVEERRRRRFGSGVRNMVAIQRSSDARRGVVAGESEPEGFLGRHGGLAKPDRDKSRGHRPVQAAVPGENVGGPSVFSFGFDIGISFNGGS